MENGWAEAQAELASGKEKLQKAADELAEWEGYQALSNQFLLRFSASASPSAVLSVAEAALQDANVLSSYLSQDSPVKQRMDYALTAVFVFCAMILSHLLTMRAEGMGYCGGCKGKRIAL